jgi:hypothetical protein
VAEAAHGETEPSAALFPSFGAAKVGKNGVFTHVFEGVGVEFESGYGMVSGFSERSSGVCQLQTPLWDKPNIKLFSRLRQESAELNEPKRRVRV